MRTGSGLGALLEVGRSGLVAVLLRPLPSVTTVACLVAMIAPYLLAVGLSCGVRDQAAEAVEAGADLHVSALRFGRPAPLPLSALELIRRVPGVRSVEPRVVGATVLGAGREPVVLVGVTGDSLPAPAGLVSGRMWHPGAGMELVLGSDLASRLGLEAGARIPPFYRNDAGEHVASVVGLFRSDLPIWQAHLMFTSLETAQEVFAEPGHVTELLVRCPPEYREAVRDAILRLGSLAPPGASLLAPRVLTRDQLEAALARRTSGREGAFTVQYVVAFAVGIPLVLTSIGLGLGEQRRDVGLLKALGWRTDEVVLRGLVESVTLAVLGTSASVVLVWVWVRWLDAAGVARLFLPDAAMVPGFDLPFRLLPEPLLLAALVALVVTTTGSLWSSWRAAATPPAAAMR